MEARNSWKHYLPALVLFLLALVSVTFPDLTVFLVSLMFVSLAILYAWIIYKIHKLQRISRAPSREAQGPSVEIWDIENPTFGNVARTVVRTRGWYGTLTPRDSQT